MSVESAHRYTPKRFLKVLAAASTLGLQEAIFTAGVVSPPPWQIKHLGEACLPLPHARHLAHVKQYMYIHLVSENSLNLIRLTVVAIFKINALCLLLIAIRVIAPATV